MLQIIQLEAAVQKSEKSQDLCPGSDSKKMLIFNKTATEWNIQILQDRYTASSVA
jgi:hypothetical protein